MPVLGAKKCPDVKTMCCTPERGPVGARERRALVEIHQALEWAAPVRLSSAAPAGCAGGRELQPAPRLLPTHCKLGESCQPGNQQHRLPSAEADWKWFELIYLILLIRELGALLGESFLIRCVIISSEVGRGNHPPTWLARATWPCGWGAALTAGSVTSLFPVRAS